MCRDCLEEYGAISEYRYGEGRKVLVEITPEMWELAGLCWDWYRQPGCGIGGPLHVVLDDVNVEDDVIDACFHFLHYKEKPESERRPYDPPQSDDTPEMTEMFHRIVDDLRSLSLSQRALVTELADPYDKVRPVLGMMPHGLSL